MANIKISELNPLLTVEDADVLPIVDNAVTKKVTAAILRSYTEGNSVLLTGAQTIAGIKTFTSQLASSVATGTAPFLVASTTKVTNLNADLLDGLSSADFQATLSGTGIVKSTAGTISYLTDNSTNWNTAFNDKINSAAVTGSGTNTLTLTQQDAGTITATWVNGTLIREIRNNTGATLTKGTIVYISGATGNKPTVTKAIATGDSTSAQTFGFVQNDILNNAEGFVVVIGDLIGLDTSAFTEGDQLYLSSTVAGAFTDVKQYAPNHLVYVGIVTRAHPTLGQIEVNIQNGYEMDELHNVAAQNPSNGDILQYVTSTGLWTKIGGTTSAISEGSNLYFTNARSRSAISLTTTGTSGAATYNSTTGVLNVPNYADTDTGITSLNGLTALTQTFAVGTSGTDFNISSATSTHTFNLPTASATNRGALSSADWTTFNNKQNAITLTTTGTSGAATLVGSTLNIPQYQSVLTNPITGTGTTNYLPKFTGASALGNSLLQEGTNVIGFGTPNVWGGGANALQINDGSIWGVSSLNGYVSIGGNYYYDSSYKYIKNSKATDYFQYEGEHTWRNAPTGIAGDAIAFTQRMTLNASGNLGLGVTPKAWGNNNKVLETTFSTSLIGRSDFSALGRNFFYNSGDDPIYSNNGFASGYFQADGEHLWVSAASGTAGNTISFAQTMTLNASGQLLLGTTTSGSYKLDVNGTARVGVLTATLGQFSQTISTTSNAESSGSINFLYATNTNSRTWRLANDVDAYGDFAIQQSTTRTGSTFANKLIFSNAGEATFSSSVTTGADATINGVRVGRGAGNIASNTAVGFEAAFSNISGTSITATGYQALKNCTGNNNTAFGNQAGQNITSAQGNTGVGSSAIRNTSTGGFNVAVGINALSANTTGGNNTAVGNSALSLLNGSFNSALGANTQHGGFGSSVILGADAIATASNQFVVGASGRNAGTVTTEVNTSTKVWNVIINGVAQKILLA